MKREYLLATMAQDSEETGGEDVPEATARLAELGKRMRAAKEELDELKKLKKEKQKEYDRLREEELPEAMAAAGLVSDEGKGSFTLPDGSTVYLRNSLYSYVRKADRGELNAWLRSQGHQDLIKESVHHSTLKAFVREQMERGEDVPPMVQTHFQTRASIRSG